MMTFDEVSALRDVLARSLALGSPAVVATLVARDGHSYRDPGAMMVMTEALDLVGGVSGGCLEGYVGRAGRRLLRDRESVLLSFDTATEAPDRPTLGCGGRLQILVERSRPEHLAYLDALLHAMRTSDRAATLITFDDDGANPDVRRCRTVIAGGQLLFGDADGVEEARPLTHEVVALRECVTFRTGGATRTASYLWPQPRLVIFGARDDAMPLVQMARTASWHVTVADRRSRLATPSRFPEADVVIDQPWPAALAAIAPAPWTRWTSAVLMTHSLEDDLELLPGLLAVDLDYLGVLGPSARTERLWESISTDDRARVHSPVGVPLGEKSAAAVAVAIMAQLIAHRRGRRAGAGRPVAEARA